MSSKEKPAIIKIPKDLADKIDKVLEMANYKSRAEFTREAIRKLLKEYGVPFQVE